MIKDTEIRTSLADRIAPTREEERRSKAHPTKATIQTKADEESGADVFPPQSCAEWLSDTLSSIRWKLQRFFLGLWSRILVYPLFYLLYFAYFLTYFIGMVAQVGSPSAMRQTASSSISTGAKAGFLPDGTLGGPPWLPGRTCLALPAYYDFDTSQTQRVLIPWVYAFMHGALTAVSIMPLPLCYAIWTRIVGSFPSVRHYIPIDDFVYVHRLLGFTAITCVFTGALLWLLAMVPSCKYSYSENACDAFDVSIGDGPFTNVLVLRLVVAPLWFGFLPLLIWADLDWVKVEVALAKETKHQLANVREHTAFGRLLSRQRTVGLRNTRMTVQIGGGKWADGLIRLRAYWKAHLEVAPALVWFSCAVGMTGSSFFFYLVQRAWAAWIGFVVLGALGFWLTKTKTLQRNWFEVCYWSHMFVAYVTISIALIARIDVFWPCFGSWGLVAFDRCVLMRFAQHTFYIQASECRVVNGDTNIGRSDKLRLVLRAVSHGTWLTFHANGASNWVYLRVTELDSRARNAVERRVMRAWHPFSVAGTQGGNLELYIDVHGKYSWTRALSQAVKKMQDEDGKADRRTSDGNRVFDLARKVEVCGPFGSSFSRCFQMRHRKNRIAEPAYDIVILYGSGIGVPSAVSALCEFIERCRYGTQVPSIVYFIWQVCEANLIPLAEFPDFLNSLLPIGSSLTCTPFT